MTNREIPKAAVEASARYMQTVDAEEGFGDYPLSEYTEFASEILEAAAPHMLAGYFETKPPEHQCEPWQLQANGRVAFRACSACGENQE